MSIKSVNEVLFQEYTHVKVNNVRDLKFDVVASKENYGKFLLEKVFTITHSQIPEFINYHLAKVKDKNTWLNKFEKLIAENEILFESQKNKSRLVKLYTTIEITRHKLNYAELFNYKNKPISKLINAESEKRFFSFEITLKQLDEIENDCDKILFLTNEIFEYKQANIDFRNVKLEEYDKLCKTKIEQIKKIIKLKEELKAVNNFNPIRLKLKFNGNINQLVDIFYRLSKELFIEKQPLLEASNNDIISLLTNNFVDKDGNPINQDTIRTILVPSKTDKRPSNNKKIKI